MHCYHGSRKLSDGTQGFYFQTSPVFEAPMDSKYAWLNDAIFVCTPFFEKDMKKKIIILSFPSWYPSAQHCITIQLPARQGKEVAIGY